MRREIPQLIITGSIARDAITVYPGLLLDHLSLLHPNFSLSLLVNELNEQWGGTAANIAYTAALLGQHPLLLASIGEQDHHYIKSLADIGVDTESVHYSSVPTARFTVITDTENNQLATFFPGAMADSDSLSIAGLGRRDVFVMISPHDPKMMEQQVHECQALDTPFCFDIGQQVNNVPDSLLSSGLQYAHAVILNAHEREVLGRRLSVDDEALPSKVPLFVTTYGKDGSLIEGTLVKRPIHIDAPKPNYVADPTGAGDSFRAAFFTEYIRRMHTQMSEEQFRFCGQMGAIAALYAIENKGGQSHFFTREEFDMRYASLFG